MKAIRWIVLGVIAVVPARAWACLNDREIVRAEKEFRSSYGQDGSTQGDEWSELSSRRTLNWGPMLGMLGGAAMMTGAFFITRKKLSS